jgi:mannosyl-3-phosphoglycerate phosphatase
MADGATTNSRSADVVVFTDLDGTLLDHDTYSFAPAQPALAALAARAIPVVPATSKTRAELAPLMAQLGLSGAAIAENGGVIMHAASPSDTKPDIPVTRQTITAALDALPTDLRSPMQCFQDMDIGQIAAVTGLSPDDAARAAAREASEPFLWRKSGPPPATLSEALAKYGLCVTRGGRFFHIVPPRDKAAAIATVLAARQTRPQSWVLGDGPNDVSMLLAADRGALIANAHIDTQALLPAGHCLYISRQSGPAGWHEAIVAFLQAEFG